MSRIRTIKPEWLDDEEIVLLGSDARTLSVALIILADDYGNGRANRLLLRSRVFPVSDQSVLDTALLELERARFVELYELDGQSYFHIRNWNKHQRVDKPGKPRVPQPREISRKPRERSRKTAEPPENVPPVIAPDLYHDHERRSIGGDARAAREPPVPGPEIPSGSDPDYSSGGYFQTFRDIFAAQGQELGFQPAPEATLSQLRTGAKRAGGLAKATGVPFAAACSRLARAALEAQRATGKDAGLHLLSIEPGRPPTPGRGARASPSAGTTGKDFEDEEDLSVQMARLQLGT